MSDWLLFFDDNNKQRNIKYSSETSMNIERAANNFIHKSEENDVPSIGAVIENNHSGQPEYKISDPSANKSFNFYLKNLVKKQY